MNTSTLAIICRAILRTLLAAFMWQGAIGQHVSHASPADARKTIVPNLIPGDVDHLAFRIIERRKNRQLRTMLQDGLSANLRAEDGTSLLMYAALHGDAEGVRILLDAGADPNATNHHGATALIWGAADREKVRQLVDHGANIHARTLEGATALTAAAGFTDGTESVSILLKAGADPSVRVRDKRFPIEKAAYAGNLEAVKLFLTAEISSEESVPGVAKAFQRAVGQGHSDIANYLMQWDGPGKLSQVNFGERLALAMLRSDVPLTNQLLVSGAPPTSSDLNQALLAAAYSEMDQAEIAHTLIERGADPNTEAWRGYRLLDLARMRGHRKLEKVLLESGARSGTPLKVKAIPNHGLRLKGANQATVISNAVAKSVGLLLRSSDAFLRNRESCSSCHHQDLPMVAASMAWSRGIPVQRDSIDRILFNQVKRWTPLVDRIYDHTRPNVDSPKALGYFLWGRSASGQPADPIAKAAVWYLAGTQMPDGHWPGRIPRTPLGGLGAEMSTALAIRALGLYPLAGRESEFEERIERAAQWLQKRSPLTHTDVAFQLLGLAWAKTDSAVVRKGIDSLLRTQRSDGGWAQLVNLESDAWATGLALLALHASGMETTHEGYLRGMEFLVNTQFGDGSWYVRSRSFPSQPHFDSRFPFGWDQWISAAGTALASASLVLALEPVAMKVMPHTPAAEIVRSLRSEAWRAQAQPDDAFEFQGTPTIDFARDIRPMLENSCLDCHSGDKPKGNFKMTDRASLLQGGESGVPALVPGRGAESQLIRHVTDQVEDMEMPPLRKRKTYPRFNSDQVGLLTRWIDEGARWPEGLDLSE